MTASTPFGDERDWIVDHPFGLFVHWGLYAFEGWHEQDQWRRRIPAADYVRLAERWNPGDVAQVIERWLDLAQAAGMTYGVLTTKHHDGFCLWPSAHTAFHVGNTPSGVDVVGTWCEALRARGMRVGLYYSVADWHHPAYPNQGRHHELDGPKSGDAPDDAAYLAYLRAQVTELCSDYGRIDCLWYDLNVAELDDPSVDELVQGLQPSCVINDRGPGPGDFGTPERDYEALDGGAFDRPTEACQSVGAQSWGYRREESWFTARHLMRHIAQVHAMGGRYLLNLGPDAEGRIPEPAAERLRRIGAWRAPLAAAWQAEPVDPALRDRGLFATRDDEALYVHVLEPIQDDLVLAPIVDLPTEATLLNTGEAVTCANDLLPSDHASQQGYLRLRGLPTDRDEPLVIGLVFDGVPTMATVDAVDARLAW